MVWTMRSRASFITATLVLAICFVCHVAEIFDQWDHTLQTGDDTEYAFVVLALCVGVAYSLKWFVPRITLADSLIEAYFLPALPSNFFLPCPVGLLLFLSRQVHPAAALRI